MRKGHKKDGKNKHQNEVDEAFEALEERRRSIIEGLEMMNEAIQEVLDIFKRDDIEEYSRAIINQALRHEEELIPYLPPK